MTKYGSDFLVDWGPRDTFLDPIFAQEHDAHISFGHSARIQQPAPARGWLPGRLPSRQPARARASIRNRRAHPARSQNLDRACTQSTFFNLNSYKRGVHIAFEHKVQKSLALALWRPSE